MRFRTTQTQRVIISIGGRRQQDVLFLFGKICDSIWGVYWVKLLPTEDREVPGAIRVAPDTAHVASFPAYFRIILLPPVGGEPFQRCDSVASGLLTRMFIEELRHIIYVAWSGDLSSQLGKSCVPTNHE